MTFTRSLLLVKFWSFFYLLLLWINFLLRSVNFIFNCILSFTRKCSRSSSDNSELIGGSIWLKSLTDELLLFPWLLYRFSSSLMLLPISPSLSTVLADSEFLWEDTFGTEATSGHMILVHSFLPLMAVRAVWESSVTDLRYVATVNSGISDSNCPFICVPHVFLKFFRPVIAVILTTFLLPLTTAVIIKSLN